MSAADFVHKAVVGLIGLSLSINAWLIKERVSEMATALKEFGVIVSELRIEAAVTRDKLQRIEAKVYGKD